MSFFIRSKDTKTPNRKRKFSKASEKSKNVHVPSKKDEDIPSSEDESSRNPKAEDHDESEDENETAQDKKLRLAKVYLKEIEAQVRRKREREELEQEQQDEHDKAIQQRLFYDHLKQTGRFRSTVADQYKSHGVVKVLKAKEHKNTVCCICISLDDQFLYSGSKDGGLVKWSLTTFSKVASLPFVKNSKGTIQGHGAAILAIALSDDNQFLAVGDTTSNIQIWAPKTLKHLKTLKGHKNSILGLTFRRSTHTLYSASADRSVKVWSLDEMSYVETLYGHLDAVTSIDALSRERAITAGGQDTSLRMWKIPEESQLIYNGDSGSFDVVKLINDATFISGGDNGQLSLWSINKKKAISTIKAAHGSDETNNQPFWVSALAALVNTDLIASGSCNGHVRIWKVEDGKRLNELFSIPVHGFVNSLAFTNDGSKLIAGIGSEHRLGRWNVVKGAKHSIVVIELVKS